MKSGYDTSELTCRELLAAHLKKFDWAELPLAYSITFRTRVKIGSNTKGTFQADFEELGRNQELALLSMDLLADD
jgi:type II restriction/modification system DNA methylase subunit YeeA